LFEENPMDIKNNRRGERYTYEPSESARVEFIVGGESKENKAYNLRVFDGSMGGFGILITQRDFDLLQKVKSGDKLKNVSFFAPGIALTMDGTVRHITKIEEGELKDCYIMGVKSRYIIDHFKPMAF